MEQETKMTINTRVDFVRAVASMKKAELLFHSILSEQGKYRVQKIERHNLGKYYKALTQQLSYMQTIMGDAYYNSIGKDILSPDSILQLDNIESSLMKLSNPFRNFFEDILTKTVEGFEKGNVEQARANEIKLNLFDFLDVFDEKELLQIHKYIKTKHTKKIKND